MKFARKLEMGGNQRPAPYRSTPIFDEFSLPSALQREHRTKPGVWGVVRVHSGQLKLSFVEPAQERLLGPGDSGLLLPDQPHFVEPVGSVRMQVDFYDESPSVPEYDETGVSQLESGNPAALMPTEPLAK